MRRPGQSAVRDRIWSCDPLPVDDDRRRPEQLLVGGALGFGLLLRRQQLTEALALLALGLARAAVAERVADEREVPAARRRADVRSDAAAHARRSRCSVISTTSPRLRARCKSRSERSNRPRCCPISSARSVAASQIAVFG